MPLAVGRTLIANHTIYTRFVHCIDRHIPDARFSIAIAIAIALLPLSFHSLACLAWAGPQNAISGSCSLSISLSLSLCSIDTNKGDEEQQLKGDAEVITDDDASYEGGL